MSLDVMDQIRRAEQAADEVRQGAQREAREMIKAVEEAAQAQQRQAAIEQRESLQRTLEGMQGKVQAEIEQAHAKAAQADAQRMAQAREHCDQAARIIFERVVNDGHR